MLAACQARQREERLSVSVPVSVLSLSLCVCACVCVSICVDVYGVLGSGAMADPCWPACALGVMILWCVLCALLAPVVLVVGLRW
eukprot:COSAG06_NODE_541_length_14471_cov_35.139229_1_plen_85_part_00